MGSDQLVGTMDIIQRQAAKKAGKAIDEEKVLYLIFAILGGREGEGEELDCCYYLLKILNRQQ